RLRAHRRRRGQRRRAPPAPRGRRLPGLRHPGAARPARRGRGVLPRRGALREGEAARGAGRSQRLLTSHQPGSRGAGAPRLKRRCNSMDGAEGTAGRSDTVTRRWYLAAVAALSAPAWGGCGVAATRTPAQPGQPTGAGQWAHSQETGDAGGAFTIVTWE